MKDAQFGAIPPITTVDLSSLPSTMVPLSFTGSAGVGVIAQTIGPAAFANNTVSITSGTISSSLRNGDTEYGKTYIKTKKHTIDLDELGDTMETLKKRLLILTPNFEQLEKYPMLKAAYDEFKMLEKLLGEPNDDK